MGIYDIYNAEKIGAKIKNYREFMVMSQQYLANELNVTVSTISKWEIGENAPKLKNLCYLAKIFGIEVDLFFSDNFQDNKYELLYNSLINKKIENFANYLSEYINLYKKFIFLIKNHIENNLSLDVELLKKYDSILETTFNVSPKILTEYDNFKKFFNEILECEDYNSKIDDNISCVLDIKNKVFYLSLIDEDLENICIKLIEDKEELIEKYNVFIKENNFSNIIHNLNRNDISILRDSILVESLEFDKINVKLEYLKQYKFLELDFIKYDEVFECKYINTIEFCKNIIPLDILENYFSILSIKQLRRHINNVKKINHINAKFIYSVLLQVYGKKVLEKEEKNV